MASEIGRVLGNDDQMTDAGLDRACATRTFVHLHGLIRLYRVDGEGVLEGIGPREFIRNPRVSWRGHLGMVGRSIETIATSVAVDVDIPSRH